MTNETDHQKSALCRLGLHAWSPYRRPNYIRSCAWCGLTQVHRYYGGAA